MTPKKEKLKLYNYVEFEEQVKHVSPFTVDLVGRHISVGKIQELGRILRSFYDGKEVGYEFVVYLRDDLRVSTRFDEYHEKAHTKEEIIELWNTVANAMVDYERYKGSH